MASLQIPTPLRRLFQPDLKPLGGGLDRPVNPRAVGGLFGERFAVLERRTCQYRYMPGRYRGRAAFRALELNLAHDTPFENTAHYIISSTDGARVWLWDRTQIPALEGQDAQRIWIPESALWPDMADGARLISCMTGVEGQIWQEGALLASRWWADEPDERQWQLFVRASGFVPSDVPYPARQETPSWQAPLLIRQPLLVWATGLMQSRLLLIGAILLLLPLSYYGVRIAYAEIASRYYIQSARSAREELAPLLAARQTALAAARFMDQQQKIGDEGIVLQALTQWVAVAQDLGVETRSFRYNEPTMTMSVVGEAAALGPQIVQALEAQPAWRDVAVLPNNRGTLEVTAELVPFSTAPASPDD